MNAHDDPWAFLQAQTTARIARGRVGHSLPTRALLDFQLDHARARDAVYAQLDTARLLAEIGALLAHPLHLRSRATDRPTYLQRPDFGRRLNDESARTLAAIASQNTQLAIVIADGLSATAVNRHALPVVAGLVGECRQRGWSLAPLALVEQGRVAIGDEIGHALGAELVVVLIGERPGLSSPDSLGAYLTYRPHPGLTDESRNCVSNIRPAGMTYALAVQKITYLLDEMRSRRLSGVALKDQMPDSDRQLE